MIYEYKCVNKKCNKTTNLRSMIKARPEFIDCPECKSKAFRREIPSKIGIGFKGDGFYCTDNKKGE